MALIVTGAAGFIGYHLTAHFLRAGYTVIGIDNLSRRGCEENLELLRCDRFQFHQTDIRDRQAIDGIFRQQGSAVECVIHEAGQVAVTASVADPRQDFEINALGTLNLLEACREFTPDAGFVFASTNKVYGGIEQIPVFANHKRYDFSGGVLGVSERQPLDFHSPYGCSKGAADQYVRDYGRIYGMRTVVLRQSCIYGARQFGIEDQGWIAWMTIAASFGREIFVFGDGKQVRDVLWISDLVALYDQVINNLDRCRGRIYNAGGGRDKSLSILELLEVIESRLGRKPNVQFRDWRPGDQKVYISDHSQATADLGWVPTVCPSQGVGMLAGWIAENRTLIERILF